IWRLDPNSGVLTRVGQINRDAVPEGQTDSRPTDIGNWESSGIVDVSSLFDAAPGTLFLFDVQAHSLRDGIIADAGLVEGGQLAFLRFGQTGPNEISTVAKNGLFFVELPNGMEVSLKYEDQPLAAGTFGNWQILEAETVGGVNQVLWQNPDTNQFGLWNTDANWNWLSSQTWPTNSFKTLQAEVTFQIDLNNDQLLGDRLTNVETKGNVSLLEGVLGNYYAQTGDGLTTPIKYLGEVFDNNLGNWQALAAETVQGINQVLWQNLDTNQIGVWNASSDWNWLSSSVFAAGSPEAIAQANIFGVSTTTLTTADSVLI
ncbi:hypothetical protein IQ225_03135, partial [Synechocystis salina LEGE 06155]|nr:hypothetical protein [Synechocystis salina LEGE 06155]